MAYKIIKKEELTVDTKLFEISAPLIADKAKPGQFVMLRIDEDGERIPLTIAKTDKNTGTITIVFQEVGKTTKQLGTLNEGDSLKNLVGPLGNPAEIKSFGTVVCVGGGVGIACVFPEIKAMKEAGNEVVSIIGARNESLLLFEDEINELSDEFYITTDDGSKGHHGFVSDILKKLIDDGKKIDLVIAVGPIVMMKVIANLTKQYDLKTIVSLNPIMVDGTGMCGSCRVEVGGETKFACVDGPEFDAHKVDFDLLTSRNCRYRNEEGLAVDEHCRCE